MSYRCFYYNFGGKLDTEFSCDCNCVSYLWVFLGFGLLVFLWNQNFIAEKPLNAKSCEDSGICQKWEQNFLLQESEGNHWQSSWLLRKCSLLMATSKLGTFICRKNCKNQKHCQSSNIWQSEPPPLYVRGNFWVKFHRGTQRCSPVSSTCGDSLGSTLAWNCVSASPSQSAFTLSQSKSCTL